MKINVVAVGERFDLIQPKSRDLQYLDGSIVEALGEGLGMWQTIFFNKPTEEEKYAISEESIEVRFIKEGMFILPMIRFGRRQFIFEWSFDPTLYKDNRALEVKDQNNMLTIVLLDSSTMIVNAIRRANLPIKFIQESLSIWSKAYLEVDYSSKFLTWYSSLQKYSLETLWDRAEPAGEMGEVYNLNEVHYNSDSQFYRD